MPARHTVAVVLVTAVLVLAGCAAAGTGAPSTARTASDEVAVTPDPTTTDAGPAASATADPAAHSEGAYVEYADGAIEATQGAKALFFHASWCPQCRELDEDLRSKGAPDGLTVFKVDYDSRSDLRQKYGVTLQTTIVFVGDDGEPVSSTVLYDHPTVESLVAAIP